MRQAISLIFGLGGLAVAGLVGIIVWPFAKLHQVILGDDVYLTERAQSPVRLTEAELPSRDRRSRDGSSAS